MTGNNDSALGRKVKFFRARKGWKQGVLADKAGLSQSEVSKIENGYLKGLKEETIRQLADALEIRPEVLARGTTFAPLFGESPILSSRTADEGPPVIAYFASALTGLKGNAELEIRRLDERVDKICKNFSGYPMALYRPRLNTSPTDNPGISADDVYKIDRERVATADLVIMAVRYPSLGAGMELQLALQACCAVILLIKEGQKVSRMVLGCPGRLEEVRYSTLADLEKKLIKTLDKLSPVFREFRSSHPEAGTQEELEVGARIRKLRDRRNLSPGDLADIVGVAPSYIEALETQSERIVNPSLRILRRIARALFTSEIFLLSGQQSLSPALMEHWDVLEAFATELAMPVGERRELWDAHHAEFQFDLSMANVSNRAAIGDRKYWSAKYDELKKKKASGKKLFE